MGFFFFDNTLGRGFDKHIYLPLKSFLSKPVPFPQAPQMNDVIGRILPSNVHLLSHKSTSEYWRSELSVSNLTNKAFDKIHSCLSVREKSYLSFTDDEEGVSSSTLSDDVFSIAIVSLRKVREQERESTY